MRLHCGTWGAVGLCCYLQKAGGSPGVIWHPVAGDLRPDQTFLMLLLTSFSTQSYNALWTGNRTKVTVQKGNRRPLNWSENSLITVCLFCRDSSHSLALCACSALYLG